MRDIFLKKARYLVPILVVFILGCNESEIVQPEESKKNYRVAAPIEIVGTYRQPVSGIVPRVIKIKHLSGSLIAINNDTARLINPHRYKGIDPSKQISGTYANGILNHCELYVDSTTMIDYYICTTFR